MNIHSAPTPQELLGRAVEHHKGGRLNEAEHLYRQILQIDSGHPDALHFLGVLAHQRGHHDAAVSFFEQAIARNDRVPSYHNNLGNALKALGRLESAAAAYRRALALKADHFEAHYNLGVVLQASGALDEAAHAYQRALALKPQHAGAHCNLANLHHAQGRIREAEAAYRQALAAQPQHAEALCNLGNVLKLQGRIAEAIDCYRQGIEIEPDRAEPHCNLAALLIEQDEVEAALALCRHAVTCNPNHPESHYVLGNALRERGESAASIDAYRRAIELRPDYVEARLALALAPIPVLPETTAESLGSADAFSRFLDELLAWSHSNPGLLGRAVGSAQPFYLAYRPGNPCALLSRYGDLLSAEAEAHWSTRYARGAGPRPHRTRTRLAVISGQVRRHAVWDVITRGFIAQLNPARFEIWIYHTGARTDAETSWARQHAHGFAQGPKPLAHWVDDLVRDAPDIIFYPEIGMDPTTCTLAALRLAPLQLASWGHPVTTGLPTIDVFLSGERLEGVNAENHYREKLVRLPGTGVYTEMIDARAQPWDGAGARAEAIRFALCQQPAKFDPAHDLFYARIAREVGPSEFWLATPHRQALATQRLYARLAAAFRSQGLDPEAHLRTMPWLPAEQFRGFLDAMDVYLDCPGFSGYTTAWQALHRGLPIVTWEGEYLRQRLAAGLLRQLGLIDGVASSEIDYVRIAVRWGEESRQRPHWTERRALMRAAAPGVDRNRAAIDALEQTLSEGLRP